MGSNFVEKDKILFEIFPVTDLVVFAWFKIMVYIIFLEPSESKVF